MSSQLHSAWQQLRQYPQGCNFEDDYRFIRSASKQQRNGDGNRNSTEENHRE